MDLVSKTAASHFLLHHHGSGPPRWNYATVHSRGSGCGAGGSFCFRAGRRRHHLETPSSRFSSQRCRFEAIFREVLVVRNLRNNEKRRRFEIDESICEIVSSQIQAAPANRKPNGTVARS